MNKTNKIDYSERYRVYDLLTSFLHLLETLQRLPMRMRLEYYRQAFQVYDMLRKRKQLGRREGDFDAVTMAEIRSYLNKFLNDGTAED